MRCSQVVGEGVVGGRDGVASLVVRRPAVDPVDGVEERGAFPGVDAVLSGYQGGDDIGDVILDAVARVKAANKDLFPG